MKERTIEFIFRVKTNATQGELDDILSYGSELLFRRVQEADGFFLEYVPAGSHWRDIGVDPTAANLLGGNRLS